MNKTGKTSPGSKIPPPQDQRRSPTCTLHVREHRWACSFERKPPTFSVGEVEKPQAVARLEPPTTEMAPPLAHINHGGVLGDLCNRFEGIGRRQHGDCEALCLARKARWQGERAHLKHSAASLVRLRNISPCGGEGCDAPRTCM